MNMMKQELFSVEDGYDALCALLETPAVSEEWCTEFNAIAPLLEREAWRENEDYALPSTMAWGAAIHDGATYILTPPMIRGTRGIRLAVPVAGRPISSGNHIYVRVLPADREPMDGDWRDARTPCITSSAPEDLIANFATWDYVARIGTAEAVRHKVITNGWVNQVFEVAAPCATAFRKTARERGNARYPADRSDLIPCYRGEEAGGEMNAQIRELNRLLQRLGITRDMLEGELTSDNGGRIYSSWFNGETCTACGKRIRSPSRAWPYPQYKHIKSIAHLKNAAEALLRLRGQANGTPQE